MKHKTTITVNHSVFIAKPNEVVWDFTQNYDERKKWDEVVLKATVLQNSPNRIVRLKMKGNTAMTFVYKLDDRPNKTSLAAVEVQSPVIESGGGSWKYEEQNGGTLWTQTNTIVLKKHFLLRLLKPLLRRLFFVQTKKAMQKAKLLLEQSGGVH
jgi:hypothetical protein